MLGIVGGYNGGGESGFVTFGSNPTVGVKKGTASGTHQTSGDCSSGQLCPEGTRCGNGVCAPLIDGPGTSCSTIHDCVAPLVCEGSKGCLPTAPLGAACDPERSFPCDDAEQTYCDPTSRVCTARKATGEACVILNANSIVGACLLYDICDAATSRCVPQGIPGAACSTSDGDLCLAFLVCDAASQTCVSPPAAMTCR
jgi:hypothetical protein